MTGIVAELDRLRAEVARLQSVAALLGGRVKELEAAHRVIARAALTAAKKPIDPNIVYPGKDSDFVFPEE